MKSSLLKKTFLLFTAFFILMGCCKDSDEPVVEKQGIASIYIEGDLTNEAAAKQLANELGSATQNIYVQNTTQLTTINIHSAINIRHIEFVNNKDLVTVKISGFKKISELWFKSNTTVPNPTTPRDINCNDIEEALNLEITLPYSTPGHNVSFNKLKKVGPNDFTLLAECNVLNFPLLETVNTFNFAVKKDIITFPALKHIETINGPSYIEFNQLNFPALQYCKKFDFPIWEWTGGAVLSIPSLQYCEEFKYIYGCATSEVTNAILHQFLTVLPLSGKSIIVYGAPPTGQGLIDKQIIINQGNSVLTN
ncbi:hypothetical protein B0A58_15550 [Flavobacterium branchiophilum NBRC 15030 = ATCC 35035]|nr:hypothetical protein [Flavobacterium branchiophilum]OXA68330.1 hypothetical protein B0A58_15550 [Flavobacterium branchiophilum NBRC 15030 = ATCC 35035]